MILDEAIKNNTENLEINGGGMYPDFAEAIQLGIEALQAYKQARVEGYLSKDELLPSEEEK